MLVDQNDFRCIYAKIFYIDATCLIVLIINQGLRIPLLIFVYDKERFIKTREKFSKQIN